MKFSYSADRLHACAAADISGRTVSVLMEFERLPQGASVSDELYKKAESIAASEFRTAVSSLEDMKQSVRTHFSPIVSVTSEELAAAAELSGIIVYFTYSDGEYLPDGAAFELSAGELLPHGEVLCFSYGLGLGSFELLPEKSRAYFEEQI